ncbi:MAG: FTR1 family protein [Anaerolineaceae bacterium]|nr:FTR1 family protein [Anaerolineaceae bacterium]
MISSFFLALREGVEATLVIGLLLGALKKTKRDDLSAPLWAGVVAAVIVSILIAVVLHIIGLSLEGAAEPAFEGLIMLFAAGLLTWMIFWMKSHAPTLKSQIESDVHQAAEKNSRRALFGVSFLTVVREGTELAIFLTAAGFAADALQTFTGALLGLAGAVVSGWVLFSSTRRLPLGTFFQVTNVLLILFAAGLFAHGIGELNEIGWVPALIPDLYNLKPILNQKTTVLGQALHAIFGYSDSPSLAQLIAYVGYFAVILAALSFFQNRIMARFSKKKVKA